MDYINVAVGQLPTGTTPRHPILKPNSNRIALLRAGEVVTERFVLQMLEKAIHEVQVHADDLTDWGMPTILLNRHVFDRRRWTDSTSAIRLFVSNLTHGFPAEPECDRRKHKRYRVNCAVAALPLDGDFQPCDPQFTATCRDLSAGGIALFHTRVVRNPYVMVEIQRPHAEPARLIMQVIRCRAVVRFYEIAGPLAATYIGQERTPEESAGISSCERQELKMRIAEQIKSAAAQIRRRGAPSCSTRDRRRAYHEYIDTEIQDLCTRYSVSRSEITRLMTEILAEQAKAVP